MEHPGTTSSSPWDELSSQRQAERLGRLVKRVDCDPKRGDLRIEPVAKDNKDMP